MSQHATNSLVVCSPDSNAATEDKCDNMLKVLQDTFTGKQYSELFLVASESLTLQQAVDSLLDNNYQSIIQNEGKILICDQVVVISNLCYRSWRCRLKSCLKLRIFLSNYK